MDFGAKTSSTSLKRGGNISSGQTAWWISRKPISHMISVCALGIASTCVVSVACTSRSTISFQTIPWNWISKPLDSLIISLIIGSRKPVRVISRQGVRLLLIVLNLLFPTFPDTRGWLRSSLTCGQAIENITQSSAVCWVVIPSPLGNSFVPTCTASKSYIVLE